MNQLMKLCAAFLLIIGLGSCHTIYKEIGFGGGISAQNFEKKSAGQFTMSELSHGDSINIYKSEVIAHLPEIIKTNKIVCSSFNEARHGISSSPRSLRKIIRPLKSTGSNKLKKQMLHENTNSKGLNLLLISLCLFVAGGLLIGSKNYLGLLLGILICSAATIVLILAAFTFIVGWLFYS